MSSCCCDSQAHRAPSQQTPRPERINHLRQPQKIPAPPHDILLVLHLIPQHHPNPSHNGRPYPPRPLRAQTATILQHRRRASSVRCFPFYVLPTLPIPSPQLPSFTLRAIANGEVQTAQRATANPSKSSGPTTRSLRSICLAAGSSRRSSWIRRGRGIGLVLGRNRVTLRGGF